MKEQKTIWILALLVIASEIATELPANAFRIRAAHQVGQIEERKMDLRYPYVVGAPKAIAVKINREIHETLNRQIGPFWPGTENMEWTSEYTVTKAPRGKLSVLFTLVIPTGGAHGSITRLVGFNCDLSTGRVLMLPTALGYRISEKQLARSIGRKLNGESSAVSVHLNDPTRFVMTENGLKFVFDELELGAATGERTVEVSRRELRKMRRRSP